MVMVELRRLRAVLGMEPGIWFFGALTCLLTYGYLEVMSRALSII